MFCDVCDAIMHSRVQPRSWSLRGNIAFFKHHGILSLREAVLQDCYLCSRLTNRLTAQEKMDLWQQQVDGFATPCQLQGVKGTDSQDNYKVYLDFEDDLHRLLERMKIKTAVHSMCIKIDFVSGEETLITLLL